MSFDWWMRAFDVLGFSIPNQGIGLGKRLRNDFILCRMGLKWQLSHLPINQFALQYPPSKQRRVCCVKTPVLPEYLRVLSRWQTARRWSATCCTDHVSDSSCRDQWQTENHQRTTGTCVTVDVYIEPSIYLASAFIAVPSSQLIATSLQNAVFAGRHPEACLLDTRLLWCDIVRTIPHPHYSEDPRPHLCRFVAQMGPGISVEP